MEESQPTLNPFGAPPPPPQTIYMRSVSLENVLSELGRRWDATAILEENPNFGKNENNNFYLIPESDVLPHMYPSRSLAMWLMDINPTGVFNLPTLIQRLTEFGQTTNPEGHRLCEMDFAVDWFHEMDFEMDRPLNDVHSWVLLLWIIKLPECADMTGVQNDLISCINGDEGMYLQLQFICAPWRIKPKQQEEQKVVVDNTGYGQGGQGGQGGHRQGGHHQGGHRRHGRGRGRGRGGRY